MRRFEVITFAVLWPLAVLHEWDGLETWKRAYLAAAVAVVLGLFGWAGRARGRGDRS